MGRRDDSVRIGLKDEECGRRFARPGDAAAVETLVRAIPQTLLPVELAPMQRRKTVGVDSMLELRVTAEHGHEEGRLAREPVAEDAATRVATARVGMAKAVVTRIGAWEDELACSRLLFRSRGHEESGQGGRPHRAKATDSGAHGPNDVSDHPASIG